MEDKWQKLKRSGAPTLQKLSMLRKISWPKALHGSPACVIADSYLLLPRRAATKAIRINGAGQTPCSDLVCLVTWKITLAFTRSHTLWQPSGGLHASLLIWFLCGRCGTSPLKDDSYLDHSPSSSHAWTKSVGAFLIHYKFKTTSSMNGIWSMWTRKRPMHCLWMCGANTLPAKDHVRPCGRGSNFDTLCLKAPSAERKCTSIGCFR